MNTNLVENKRLSHLVGEDKQYDLVMMIMKTREEVGENRVTLKMKLVDLFMLMVTRDRLRYLVEDVEKTT